MTQEVELVTAQLEPLALSASLIVRSESSENIVRMSVHACTETHVTLKPENVIVSVQASTVLRVLICVQTITGV